MNCFYGWIARCAKNPSADEEVTIVSRVQYSDSNSRSLRHRLTFRFGFGFGRHE